MKNAIKIGNLVNPVPNDEWDYDQTQVYRVDSIQNGVAWITPVKNVDRKEALSTISVKNLKVAK